MNRKDDCGSLFKRIHDSLEKRANNALRAQGLTMAQMNVLVELFFSPQGQMTLKEMERRLHVAQSTAAGIVMRLEQKGFVDSFGDAKDRRIKRIRITPAGEACCQLAEQHMYETEAALLSGFTREERSALLSLLKKVAENIE